MILNELDEYAETHGLYRSGVVRIAVREFLARQGLLQILWSQFS